MTMQIPEEAKELVETFNELDTWEDRYSYIIELGAELPDFPEEKKLEHNLVRGCQSRAWLVPAPCEKSGTFNFLAVSEASIVCGLIAILRRLYANQSFEFVANFDIDSFFADIELNKHLSSGRSNGLKSMINTIRTLAQALSK